MPDKAAPQTLAQNGSLKPMVSVVVPGYNEEAIVIKHLEILCDYMATLENKYHWELIFVNDGSLDKTGKLADKFAETHGNVKVLHHFTNFNLGQALRYAFKNCVGDYIVTMDLDLSYSPSHIERMLAAIQATRAKIVIASPYMKGGKISNVPFVRKQLSIWANRFLAMTATGKIHTITGMVRSYDSLFIKMLNTKAMDMAINAEIVYKAQLLRAKIVEIPAHLNWSRLRAAGENRSSSMRILWTILSCLFSGYLFRPFMFFIVAGLILLAVSLYPVFWAFNHTFSYYSQIPDFPGFGYRFSDAVAAAFKQSPHSFIIGGFCIIVAIQMLSIGILSLQKKRYFEELFHLQSMIYKFLQEKGVNGKADGK